jgi:hypothetical protein
VLADQLLEDHLKQGDVQRSPTVSSLIEGSQRRWTNARVAAAKWRADFGAANKVARPIKVQPARPRRPFPFVSLDFGTCRVVLVAAWPEAEGAARSFQVAGLCAAASHEANILR